MNEDTDSLPAVISVRTDEFKPLLKKWRAQNRRVAWSYLLKDALRKELAPLAGKRHAHLITQDA